MFRFRGYQWVSLVAVAGLLARIAIGIMFAPMLAMSPGAGSLALLGSGDTGQQTMNCPMMGLKKSVGEDGGSFLDKKDAPADKEGAPEDCPICLGMAATLLALSSFSFDFGCPDLQRPALFAKPVGLVLQSFARHVRNRSPPIFA